MKTRLLALACLLLAGAVHAQATYTYQSNGFGEFSVNPGNVPCTVPITVSSSFYCLQISITLPQALAPNLVRQGIAPVVNSISWGPYAPVTCNYGPLAACLALTVSTDANGNISAWDFYIQEVVADRGVTGFVSSNTRDYVVLGSSAIYLTGTPGVWTGPPKGTTTTFLALDCISNTSITPSNVAHFVLAKTPTSQSICQYPKVISPSYYIEVTYDSGKTWTWVTLASLGLGD